MPKFIRNCIVSAAALAGPLTILPLPAAATNLPEAIAVSDEVLVVTVQAAGTQIYECKADASGNLVWQFREPVATLFSSGKTVGRHYAGPHWEMADGSTVSAKVSGSAPGASEDDLPLLKLEVTSRRGAGQLAYVSTIQRINTRGGVTEGACETAGALQNVPYAADYAFYRKADASAGAAAPAASRPAATPRYVPAVVAAPVETPAVHVIVLPRDIPNWPRKKKRHDEPKKPGEPKAPPTGEPKSPPAEPKSPPTAEPKSPTPPTPPTAEPKSPTTPTGPKTTEGKKPKYVIDHRKNPPPVVRDHRQPRPEPGVRDHRGADPDTRQKPSPDRSPVVVRDHRGVDPYTRPSPQRSPVVVRDHRGDDPDARQKPSPQRSPVVIRDHRSSANSSGGGGGSVLCSRPDSPGCRPQ